MKKHNYSLLVASLISTIALVACNSGSSNNNPSPAPSPTIAPTTTPPSPVPPVTAESGAYVAGSGFTYTFSTAPSTGAWFQYSTVSTQVTDTTGTAVNTPAATAVGVTPNGILTANGTYLFVSANGAQFTQLTNNLSIATTAATSIITGGTNTIVFTPTAAAAGAQIVAVTPAGVVTQSPNFINENGTTTAPTLTVNSVIKNFGGTYYLFVGDANGITTATANTVYTSTNGINWVYAGTPTAGLIAKSITQIGSTYYAITNVGLTTASNTSGSVVSGTSPTTIATPVTLTSNGGANNDLNPTATAGITNLYTDGTSLYAYNLTNTKLYYFGNGVIQQASAQGTFAAAPALLFAGSTVYNNVAGKATAISQTGNKLAASLTQISQVVGSVVGAVTVQGSNLIVANPSVGATPVAMTGGSVAVVSSIAPTTGTTSYTVLPIATTGAGFAGTPTNYMVVGANGSAILSSNGAFVPVASIQNTSAAGTPKAAVITNLDSNGASYVAGDYAAATPGNIYVSNGVGADLTWTMIPKANMPGNGVTDVQSTGGTYFITVQNTDGVTYTTYQTATPANLASWVQTTTPRSLNTTYTNFGGTYYVLDSAAVKNMNVGVYDITSGITTTYANVLPQPYYLTNGTGNIGYNGTTFAQAQSSSANIWTSASLTGGRADWTPTQATFAAANGVAINLTFNAAPILLWTGETWLTNDSGNVLESSANGTAWTRVTSNGANITATGIKLF